MPKLIFGVLAILVLAVISLFIGVSDVTPMSLFSSSPEDRPMQVLLISRIPRTLALILSGSALAVAGLLMQMLARNRFVEPGTAGTVESAIFGILLITILWPASPLLAKMLAATVTALIGTALFMQILRRIPLRSTLMVPLVGIMLGGVIASVTDFFAYRLDLLQTLGTWQLGDFSAVLRGRYELLWIGALLVGIAWYAADRFTVAGLGQDFTTNLGLNYRRVLTLGLSIVAMVTATVVVSVGTIPFLGLIVPNLVAMAVGDNARRAIPWIVLLGAGFVLICDIIGRVIRFPYEIPIGTVFGVIGSALFLYLLLRRRPADA
ncbi:ABC transporter permease [Devosia marina]|uniref:Iron chelate uptake ABC transporter family permease subunit n=1 Tax=Devosia marina TaxID=2683198 RepID=A0A7X3K452_9HYPH|nr:iron chelate uptake ABC transporter family permease subunit [Devosia marina]MVT00027.1 iron chelate uptake ABC transporter family permease subunit [Devosia marina]